MSKRATCTVMSAEGKDKWLACQECNAETYHKVLALVATSDSTPDNDICVSSDFMIVQCQGCRAVSFCEEARCTEDVGQDPETGELILVPIVKLYPSRIVGRPELQDLYDLPHGVYRIYRETHSALCNKLPVLASAGIRAIIEAICQEKAVSGKDLKKRINGLAQAGIITVEGAKILHSLRFMGNQAVHKIKAHTELELCAAFDVVEYLLKGVYILPKQAAKLPRQMPSSGS